MNWTTEPPKKAGHYWKVTIAEFKSYITENRLLSVFSKEGQIQSPKEIGKYIKLLLTDAQDDFLKDNDISHLDKQQQKDVFNVGSLIANMLKSYL